MNIIEQAKMEIKETEKAFASMAKDKGVAEAFLYFAAEEAVLLRGNQLIKGKAAINDYFKKSTLSSVTLEWEPDYIDAASSGDLGYTYGQYTFSAVDSGGNQVKDNGVFHTVWKKQSDGRWKYVWD